MMSEPKKPEVWLRGPLPDMPAVLQPVAHALLQALEEVEVLMADFPEKLLWDRPAQLASPGFHLQHLSGVLDRLFTYARGESLGEEQLLALSREGKPDSPPPASQQLVAAFGRQVHLALAQLRASDVSQLTAARAVGRSRIPSTMLGLYVHAAEHTMRHLGQLLVTVRVLKGETGQAGKLS